MWHISSLIIINATVYLVWKGKELYSSWMALVFLKNMIAYIYRTRNTSDESMRYLMKVTRRCSVPSFTISHVSATRSGKIYDSTKDKICW